MRSKIKRFLEDFEEEGSRARETPSRVAGNSLQSRICGSRIRSDRMVRSESVGYRLLACPADFRDCCSSHHSLQPLATKNLKSDLNALSRHRKQTAIIEAR